MSIAGPLFVGCQDDDSLLVLQLSERVPDAGTRYLAAGAVATSLVGVPIRTARRLVGLSVRVDQADPSRGYDVEVLLDGVVVATLPLPAASDVAGVMLAVAAAAGSRLSARMRRTSGSGASTFCGAVVAIDID